MEHNLLEQELARLIACPRCTMERTLHDFVAGNGRRCKLCVECREADAAKAAARREATRVPDGAKATDWLTAAMLAALLDLKRSTVEAYAAKEDGIPRCGHVYERREATPDDIARLGAGPQTQWVFRAVPAEDVKRCRRCKDVQPLSQYSPSAQAKDGRASICKSCDGRQGRGKFALTNAPKEKGCDACGGKLTRNRTIKLDGRLLCHPCWKEVFA